MPVATSMLLKSASINLQERLNVSAIGFLKNSFFQGYLFYLDNDFFFRKMSV